MAASASFSSTSFANDISHSIRCDTEQTGSTENYFELGLMYVVGSSPSFGEENNWADLGLIINGSYNWTGLGIHKIEINGTTLYSHDGSGEGYLTQNIYIEETDTSIVYFLNCGLRDECVTAFFAIGDAILTELKIH